MRATTILFGLAMAALASCALHSSGLGTGESSSTAGGGATGSSSASGVSSATGSSSGASGSSGGGGGSAPVRDPVPTGAVSFFAAGACPAGWDPFTPADGRTILPVKDPAHAGASYGAQLTAGEERAHVHAVDLTFDVSPFELIAGGFGNNGIAAATMAKLSTPSEAAAASLPYAQLLVCKKTAPPLSAPLPAGVHLFFEGPACPTGWQQASATAGRFLVGLPDGAPPDMPFGGPPLDSGEPRTHTHTASATLTTQPHSLILAGGCCDGGFAKEGPFTGKATSGAAEAGLPYVELLQCQKM